MQQWGSAGSGCNAACCGVTAQTIHATTCDGVADEWDGVPNCTDVNECTTGTDNCDANATCTNTTGSFTCACNPGFTGNGVSCAALENCTCSNGDAIAPDTSCSGNPNKCMRCDYGYKLVGDNCVAADKCSVNSTFNLNVRDESGNDLSGTTETSGYACAVLCDNNVDCNRWNWLRSSGLCILRDGTGPQTVGASGYNSGNKWIGSVSVGAGGCDAGNLCDDNVAAAPDCSEALSCTSTEIANSTRSGNNFISGNDGTLINLSCDSGYQGGLFKSQNCGGSYTCNTRADAEAKCNESDMTLCSGEELKRYDTNQTCAWMWVAAGGTDESSHISNGAGSDCGGSTAGEQKWASVGNGCDAACCKNTDQKDHALICDAASNAWSEPRVETGTREYSSDLLFFTQAPQTNAKSSIEECESWCLEYSICTGWDYWDHASGPACWLWKTGQEEPSQVTALR